MSLVLSTRNYRGITPHFQSDSCPSKQNPHFRKIPVQPAPDPAKRERKKDRTVFFFASRKISDWLLPRQQAKSASYKSKHIISPLYKTSVVPTIWRRRLQPLPPPHKKKLLYLHLYSPISYVHAWSGATPGALTLRRIRGYATHCTHTACGRYRNPSRPGSPHACPPV